MGLQRETKFISYNQTLMLAALAIFCALQVYYVRLSRTNQIAAFSQPSPRAWDVRSISYTTQDHRSIDIAALPSNTSHSSIPDAPRGSLENVLDFSQDGNTRGKSLTTPSTDRTQDPCFLQIQLMKNDKRFKKPIAHFCREINCKLRYVADKSYQTMKTSDVVIFHHRSNIDWGKVEDQRRIGQKIVFFTRESPHHTRNKMKNGDYHSLDYFMTYGKYADILNPYGYYVAHKPDVRAVGARNWAESKSELIAWVASNCHTASWGRYGFVKALAKHVKVNMYGSCGNLKCARGSETCNKIINSHKFYLALENSECGDYITEKFWKNSLYRGLVPLVYGASKEDYARVAPPNSFIHLQDFASLTQVADYLVLVDSNDTLYNSYLAWKQLGSVLPLSQLDVLTPDYMCNVIPRIMQDRELEGSGVTRTSNFSDRYLGWATSCKKGVGFPRNF